MRRALGGLAAIPRHARSFAPAQRLRAATETQRDVSSVASGL
jgi:hypothetical protein